jgi:hypothetical protein
MDADKGRNMRLWKMRAGRAASLLGLCLGLAACDGGAAFDDPSALYLQRIPTVSSGAGNAEAANTAIQTITPWPRNVNDTRIPGDSTRMAAAVRKYECGAPVTIGTQTNGSSQTSGGSTSSSSTTTPLTADGCK